MQEDARLIHDIKLDDDLDFTEIIMEIEESLGICFPDDAFADIQTLGQLHNLMCREVEAIPATGNKCATSMSFYRLKDAINRTGPSRRLSPKTSLKSLSNFDYTKVIGQLGSWNTPRHMSLPGFCLSLGLTLAINIPLAFFIGAFSLITGISTLLLLLPLAARFLPSRLPSEKTVGELATRLAVQNLRHLAEQGAGLTPRTLWKALIWVVTRKTDIAHDRLSRESRFI